MSAQSFKGCKYNSFFQYKKITPDKLMSRAIQFKKLKTNLINHRFLRQEWLKHLDFSYLQYQIALSWEIAFLNSPIHL